jgi:uncharacterized iron-regulated protein
MKIFLILIIGAIMFNQLHSEETALPFKIFDKDGEEVEFTDIVDAAEDNQVVLFGEYHNNPISHFLQFKLTKALFEENDKKLILGAEMFESDDQLIINEYFQDQITDKYFSKEAKLWDNYATDYKPILEFAKENQLSFVATNIPRRYAGFVARNGLDDLALLSNEAQQYIAPLPVKFDATLPTYAALMEPMAMHGSPMSQKSDSTNSDSLKMKMPAAANPMMKKPNLSYIAQAQAVKDATMAHFINKNLKSDYIFIHLNGSYHSDKYEGINWYLKQENKSIEVLTISTVEQDSLEKLEESNLNIADFIIVVDKDMTKTH